MRWLLATRDAHGVYAGLGFEPLVKPDHMMELRREGVPAELKSASP
jgi:hypothetical protein